MEKVDVNYFPITYASEFSGISKNTLREGCKAGDIPHIKVGVEYRIPVEYFGLEGPPRYQAPSFWTQLALFEAKPIRRWRNTGRPIRQGETSTWRYLVPTCEMPVLQYVGRRDTDNRSLNGRQHQQDPAHRPHRPIPDLADTAGEEGSPALGREPGHEHEPDRPVRRGAGPEAGPAMSRNVELQTMFNIRDARGLTAKEKIFLVTVELRGEMVCTWERAAADMGMTKDSFYRTRRSLVDRHLVYAVEQGNRITRYIVNRDGVAVLVPSQGENHSHSENGLSHSANGLSQDENGLSHQAEQKVTNKKNKKGTSQEREAPPEDQEERERLWQKISTQYWSVESKKPAGQRMSIEDYVTAHMESRVG